MNRSGRQRGLYARVTAVVVYFGFMVSDLSHAEPLASLDSLRWERRVLLVFAVDSARENVRGDVRATLEAEAAGLADREVTWFLLDGEDVVETNHAAPLAPGFAAALYEGLSPVGRPLDVLLIGKDGGLKQRSPSLDIEALFELIDGMPMRRREIEARPPETAGSVR